MLISRVLLPVSSKNTSASHLVHRPVPTSLVPRQERVKDIPPISSAQELLTQDDAPRGAGFEPSRAHERCFVRIDGDKGREQGTHGQKERPL